MATLTLTVATSTDDAKLDDVGYADNSTTANVGAVGGAGISNSGQGWRFTSVTLANTVTVTSAILKLMKSGTAFAQQDNRWTCEAADNSATFSAGSAPGSRSIVATIVAESNNVNETDATTYEFPRTQANQDSFGGAVNTVVTRAGWSSGNALSVINQSKQDASQGTGFSRKVWHYQDSSTASSDPQLFLTYTTPSDPGVQAKVNVLSSPAATGDVIVNDMGFKPKTVMAFYGNQTGTGSAANAHMGFGFTSSNAEDLSTYHNSKDNVATSAVLRSLLTTAWLKTTVEGATTARCTATMTALNNSGFTANFSAVISGAKFPYVAIGGSSITNTAAGQIAMTTDTSNMVVSSLSFQPDILFLSVILLTATGTAVNNNCISFGVLHTSGQWAVGVKGQNSQATKNTSRAFASDCGAMILSSTADTILDKIGLVSMNSNGFTLSHPTSSATAYLVNYVAIKGGNWNVGNLSQPSSTGNQSITGLSFQPVGTIFASACDATDQTGGTSASATARMCVGAATSSSERQSIWMGDQDNLATSKADSRYATDKCILHYTEAGLGAPTVNAEADYVSNNSDGFTINWTTADATARKVGYVTFGNATGGGGGTTYSITRILLTGLGI